MTTVAPRPALSLATERARIIARLARDRFAPPATIAVLNTIARHLDTAADHLAAHTPATLDGIPLNDFPMETAEALWEAEALAEQHPDTRFPLDFTNYVLAPLSGRPLPTPDQVHPVSPGLAAREAELRHLLTLLHGELNNPNNAGDTDRWLTSAIRVQRDLMRLAAEVAVDNARPCNQR